MLYVVVCCASCVVCFVPGVHQAKHRKEITKMVGKSHLIFKNLCEIASRSASERLLQHLEAFQSLGMALDIHKVRVTSASWPQKCLPESHWAARGTSLGHFFEARGRHFLEKTATKIHVY